MWAPGLTGLAVGILLLFAVRDSPEQSGFPPVEVVEKAKPKADGSEAPKESLLTLLVNNVLKNPFIWGMALTYFFIYVVRQGVTSWFVFYLIKVCSPCPLLPSQPFAACVLHPVSYEWAGHQCLAVSLHAHASQQASLALRRAT